MERISVEIVGKDSASDDLKRVGQAATAAGRDVTRANQDMARGFRGAGDAATEMGRDVANAEKGLTTFSRTGAALGAVMGTVGGLLSEFARAAAEEEATFARLESAVEGAGDSIDDLQPALDAAIAGAEEMSFADDQAADALARLTATTGSTAEAIDLLALTMDVARGRNISLAAAADLVGKVAEGNLGILSRYGIVLDEGATATEALGALQQRYGTAAEKYASTTQGAIDRLKNSFENWAESVGASTGDVQTLLTLLPGLSAGFSGVATVVGGLAGLLGPIGLLAVAAVAAGGAIAYLVTRHEEQEAVVIDVDEAVDSLIDTLQRLAEMVGTGAPQFVALDAWTAQLTDIIELQNKATAAAAETQQALADAAALRVEVPEGDVQIPGQLDEAMAQARADAIAQATRELEAYSLAGDRAVRVEQALAAATGYTGEAFIAVSRYVEEAFADFERGRIDAEGLIARLEQIPDVALAATVGAQDLAGATTALTDSMENFLVIGERFQARQAEIAAGLAEAAARQADYTRAVNDTATAREQAIAAARQHNAERQTEIEAIIAARDASLANARALEGEIVSLDDAALAMGSMAYASFAAVDGLVSLTEQERLLMVQGSELAAQQSEVGDQLSFDRGAVNDMEAAYEILQARQAAGEALNQDQLDFMAEYAAEVDGTARTIDDLVVQQGILRQEQIDNAEAQGDLTTAMADTGDSIDGLVDVLEEFITLWAELMGLEPPDLSPPERTAIAWTEVMQAIKLAKDVLAEPVCAGASATLAAITGRLGATVAGDATAGPGGTTVANRPPPTGVLPVSPAAPVIVPVVLDVDPAIDTGEEFDAYLDGLFGDARTVTIVGEGADAYAVIEDVNSNVVGLVQGDYVVVLEGNNDGALSDAEAVQVAMNALDGDTATVIIYGNANPARGEITSVTGHVGDAYVNIYANRIGFTDVALAHGGLVPSTLIRAGEVGPELIRYPGGGGTVAARDGMYVVPQGSYVSTAPATRAMGLGRQTIGPITINVYAQDGRDAGRQIEAALLAIGR